MNNMRKLMEAVQLNEYNLDDFGNDDLIEQLAQNIAEQTMHGINLTHENSDHVRKTSAAYAEGMVAHLIKNLRNDVSVHIQAHIDEFVSSDNALEEQGFNEVADPAKYQHSEREKGAFIAGWEWALATDWNDQLDSEAGYVKWASGEKKPESY